MAEEIPEGSDNYDEDEFGASSANNKEPSQPKNSQNGSRKALGVKKGSGGNPMMALPKPDDKTIKADLGNKPL